MITTTQITFHNDGTYVWKSHHEIIGNGTINDTDPVYEGTYYIENDLIYMLNVSEDFVIPIEDVILECETAASNKNEGLKNEY